MHRDTTRTALPALTAYLLGDNDLLVDNVFADLWKQVSMETLLNRVGFKKRSGTPIPRLVFSLVLWVWLKAGSIALFEGHVIQGLARLISGLNKLRNFSHYSLLTPIMTGFGSRPNVGYALRTLDCKVRKAYPYH